MVTTNTVARKSGEKMARAIPAIERKPPTLQKEEPLNEQVYQRLKWALTVGDYAPGDTLSIRKIAAELNISMMPVREALKRLVSERALVSSANRSFRVDRLAPKRISDLFFVRSSLESTATKLAAPLLTTAQIDRLEELADQMDEDVDKGDMRSYICRNYSFHFTIYTASMNAELVAIIESLWMQTGPYLRSGVSRTGMSRDWRQKHRQIADAIRARDTGLARELIELDINWGTKVFGSEVI